MLTGLEHMTVMNRTDANLSPARTWGFPANGGDSSRVMDQLRNLAYLWSQEWYRFPTVPNFVGRNTPFGTYLWDLSVTRLHRVKTASP